MDCYDLELFPVTRQQHAVRCVAECVRLFQYRIEHRREIACVRSRSRKSVPSIATARATFYLCRLTLTCASSPSPRNTFIERAWGKPRDYDPSEDKQAPSGFRPADYTTEALEQLQLILERGKELRRPGVLRRPMRRGGRSRSS